MSYVILPRQKANAKKLGVSIKPSINKKKKIDIYRDGKKIANAGAIGYKDYSVYLKEDGKEIADKKKKAYRARHKYENLKKDSNGYFAWFILWN